MWQGLGNALCLLLHQQSPKALYDFRIFCCDIVEFGWVLQEIEESRSSLVLAIVELYVLRTK
jgi:hypothetical protein